MTDLIYITGGKSMWGGNELRYSLRSMHQHLRNIGQVFIVGTCPEWLQGITHIQVEDITWMKKEPRLYWKRLVACRDSRISDSAIFAYDDEYLLTSHDADNFPNYFDGDVQTYFKRIPRPGHHKRCAANTIRALGGQARMYDVHCPMRVSRSEFISVLGKLNWEDKDGYLIKSSYGAASGDGTPITDIKINHPDGTAEEYREMIANRPWFSTGDNMNFEALECLMQGLYPEPSPYEK